MFDELISGFQRHAEISSRDMEKIISVLKVRHVKKRRNILNEGDDCQQIFFLNRGLCRYYINDQTGAEQTIELIAPHNWFGDAKAFLLQKTATINIEALEESEVFALGFADVNRFYDDIPMFERAARKITEYYFVKAFDRFTKVNRTGQSALSRYLEFVKAHPDLVNRIPSIHLASYLGLAPETLSRLRHTPLKSDKVSSIL
jgi:CRP-like cAMP-binding protein